MATSEVVVFNGVRYRRYPNAKQRSDQVYFVPGIGDRQKGRKRLHEEIWMSIHGPIPEGCHIHHKDHDPLNNDPDNLVCLSEEDHRAYHADQWRGTCSEAKRVNLENIRPLAAVWHGSEEGLEWHREHGRRVWESREAVEFACQYAKCGKPYRTASIGLNRFCSNACKSAFRRDSGVDDVDRVCCHCGTTFRINKYSKATHCTKSCGRLCSRDPEGGCYAA